MKKVVVILSIVVAAMALVILMLSVASANSTAVEPVFDFIKETGNPTVTDGDVFTVTLTVSPTALTGNLAETVLFTVTDPNYYPQMLEFVTTTATAPAYWDPDLNAVVWTGQVASTTTGAESVSFQVRVNKVTYNGTQELYNVAFMKVVTTTALPGSLPGTLPSEVVGSLPAGAELPASDTVVWDTFTTVRCFLYLPLVTRNYSASP